MLFSGCRHCYVSIFKAERLRCPGTQRLMQRVGIANATRCVIRDVERVANTAELLALAGKFAVFEPGGQHETGARQIVFVFRLTLITGIDFAGLQTGIVGRFYGPRSADSRD